MKFYYSGIVSSVEKVSLAEIFCCLPAFCGLNFLFTRSTKI